MRIDFGRLTFIVDRVRFYLGNIQFALVVYLTIKSGLDPRVILAGLLLIPLVLYVDMKRIYSQEQNYRAIKNPVYMDMVERLKRIEEKISQ